MRKIIISYLYYLLSPIYLFSIPLENMKFKLLLLGHLGIKDNYSANLIRSIFALILAIEGSNSVLNSWNTI